MTKLKQARIPASGVFIARFPTKQLTDSTLSNGGGMDRRETLGQAVSIRQRGRRKSPWAALEDSRSLLIWHDLQLS